MEHDAEEIWTNVDWAVKAALDELSITPADLAAVGVTNQRETTLIWDKATGEPIHNAIVWQDTRTGRMIEDLAKNGGQDRFRAKTGLPLATYFAGPKIAWLLDHVEGARGRAEAGELLFGTMETWIIWKLTHDGEAGRHVTDVTNASRTLLMDLETLEWGDDLLGAIGVPRAILPEICSSSEVYGEATGVLAGVKVAGALGDQQAALFGQACFEVGEGKCTYGTGGFLLLNTGEKPVASKSGLLTTVGYRIGNAPAVYALEGSIAVAGSLVQWFRDNVGARGDGAGYRRLGGLGGGLRRLLFRARLLRLVRPLLAIRCAGRDCGPYRLYHQSPPRPRRARSHGLAGAGGGGGDERRQRTASERAQS